MQVGIRTLIALWTWYWNVLAAYMSTAEAPAHIARVHIVTMLGNMQRASYCLSRFSLVLLSAYRMV